MAQQRVQPLRRLVRGWPAGLRVTTWLLAMLPGPGQALMIRQVLGGGRRAAWGCVAGNASGLLLWSTAAALGLSAVLLANPQLYAAVRIVGGVVLFLLGVTTLRAARAGAPAHPDGAQGRTTGLRAGYLTGLGTCLGNPKAGVFAVSVLPQFVTEHGPVLLSSIALGALWALVTVGWYVLFTWAVARGRDLLARPAAHRALGMATGVVLLLVGTAVVTGI
jgi:threonine/homoserine/homoserine lactone efflux protein